MSISDTVASLATALRDYLVTRGGPADVIAMLEAVAEMPAYVRDERLDLWEQKVNASGHDRDRLATDRAYRAAQHVYALGTLNMYAAIEEEETAQAYADVVTELRELGVPGLAELPSPDLADW
ncbi:MAG: hypothetical protein H0T46_23610 [Deltaproteobacteria bacterium]|nr:hypothetical protein [Deltaproteobacteria bacterium]